MRAATIQIQIAGKTQIIDTPLSRSPFKRIKAPDQAAKLIVATLTSGARFDSGGWITGDAKGQEFKVRFVHY